MLSAEEIVTAMNGRPSVVLTQLLVLMRRDSVLSFLKYAVNSFQSASLRSVPGLNPKAASGESDVLLRHTCGR